jgi:hypothetical protein
MENAPRKPRKKHNLRRWFRQQQDDLWILAGCALILFGTWQTAPWSTLFVAGAMCWGMALLISLGRRG